MDENRQGQERKPLLPADSLKRRHKPRKNRMWAGLLSAVVVLAVAVGGYYLADMLKPAPEETPAAPTATMLPLLTQKTEDVDKVTVTHKDGQSYTMLQPEAGTYQIEGMPNFDFDAANARSVVSSAATLSASRIIEENAKDLAPYGLDDPDIVAEVTYKDGSQRKLLIGSQIVTGTGRYAMVDADPNVYMIYNTAYTALSRTVYQLHTVPNVALPQEGMFKRLYVSRQGQDPIEIQFTDASSDIGILALKLTQPIYYDAHSDRAQELYYSMAAISLSGFAGEAQDLAQFGLDQPWLRLEVDMEDGQGGMQPVPALYMDVGLEVVGSDNLYYCRVDDSMNVYTVSGDLLSFTETASVPRLVDQFANLVNIQKVDSVEILGEGEQYVMSIQREPKLDEEGNQTTDGAGKPATTDTFFLDGQPIDESLFKKAYQEVIGQLVNGMMDDYDYVGKTVVSVKYQLNTGQDPFQVDYMEYDKDYYAVRRDNVTLFYIKHEKLSRMFKALSMLREGTYTGTEADFLD